MNNILIYSIISIIIIAIILGVISGIRKHHKEKGHFEIIFPLAPHVNIGQTIQVTINGIKGPAMVVKKFKGTNRIRVRKL